ncbi:MAG: hypothetical protein ACFFD6_11650 [Candidatus Thorarchaeota archaeon]
MTEIPLPPSDGYVEPSAPSKGRGCGTNLIIGLIIAIIVVGGIVVVLLPNLGGNGASYDERQIQAYNNQDISLSPMYYSDEFYVYSSEVQTSTAPDLLFEIDFDHTGSDSVSVDVYCAIYDIDKTTVDDAPTWAELDSYKVGEFTRSDPVSDWIDLHNSAGTYTWVIWFDASSKTSEWSVDITLTLRYNW